MNSTTPNTTPEPNKIIIRIPGWFNVRKDAKIYPATTEFPFRQRPRANAYVSDTESDSDHE